MVYTCFHHHPSHQTICPGVLLHGHYLSINHWDRMTSLLPRPFDLFFLLVNRSLFHSSTGLPLLSHPLSYIREHRGYKEPLDMKKGCLFFLPLSLSPSLLFQTSYSVPLIKLLSIPIWISFILLLPSCQVLIDLHSYLFLSFCITLSLLHVYLWASWIIQTIVNLIADPNYVIATLVLLLKLKLKCGTYKVRAFKINYRPKCELRLHLFVCLKKPG